MAKKEPSVLVLGRGADLSAVCDVFSDAGASVTLVPDAGAAVPALLNTSPQLVVLDFVSASEAALHFYSALRSVSVQSVDSRVPVVALVPEHTSLGPSQVVKQVSHGSDVVLEAPLDETGLVTLRQVYKTISGGEDQSTRYSGDNAPACLVYPEDVIAEEYGLDAADMAVLYTRLVDSLPQELAELERIVRIGDMKLVARLAHSMAGSFLDMIASGPAQTARSMEHYARSGDVAQLGRLMKELTRQCKCILKEVRSRLR